MCGRSSITLNEAELEKAFDASFYSEDTGKYLPLYNMAPTHMMPIISLNDAEHFRFAHWGFKRLWKNFKTGKFSPKVLFNARGETVDSLKTYKDAFHSGQRCLIIFDGFFEWMQTEIGKVPFRIQLKSKDPFAVAGLYEENQNEKGLLCSTVITTLPNQMMALVHNKPGKERMPAILHPHHWKDWIDPGLNPNQAKELIYTYPAEEMSCYPISSKLNGNYDNLAEYKEPVHYDFEAYDQLLKASEEFGFELLI